MIFEEFENRILSIIDNVQGCGFEMYACIKENGELIYKSFVMDDDFKESIRQKIETCLRERFLDCESEIKPIVDLHDNTNSLYEILQDDTYHPFRFLRNERGGKFKDTDKSHLCGFVFKFNINSNSIWVYQQVYPIALPKKHKGLFMYSQGTCYKEFTKDLIRVDYRIDLLIIDESIITNNINLLQNKFGFETLIRRYSSQTLEVIKNMGIIKNIDKLINFEGKEKLTNAKKLMKIKESKALLMNRSDLIFALQNLPRYRGKLYIEDAQIILRTNSEVIELLKILNDDYLVSELTREYYESPSKKLVPV